MISIDYNNRYYSGVCVCVSLSIAFSRFRFEILWPKKKKIRIRQRIKMLEKLSQNVNMLWIVLCSAISEFAHHTKASFRLTTSSELTDCCSLILSDLSDLSKIALFCLYNIQLITQSFFFSSFCFFRSFSG